MQTVNPATGRPIRDHEEHDADAVSARIEAAVAAQRAWRTRSFDERSAVLKRLAMLLIERSHPLGAIATREMGKPIAEAVAEIRKCAHVCAFYAQHAEAWLAPDDPGVDEAEAYVRMDPLGVVFAVMPWNFPFWQALRFAAPALMAGNTILLKPAPSTVGCTLAIEDLGLEAGLPAGCLSNLVIDVDAVPGVIAHPGVAAVTVTGSERAGAAVASAAGANLKRSVLELGGSDAFIVLADADLDLAVENAVKSRCLNTGQVCCAAKRFVVVDTVADAFQERFAEAMSALRIGDPMEPGIQVGPMARLDLREQLADQVQRAVAGGARILTGGDVPEVGESLAGGWFYSPTVLADVEPGNPAFEEEVFGPVGAVVRARDAEHAVELANRSQYGLTATIWTADRDLAKDMAQRLEVGGVFVNKMAFSDPRIPFGGVKKSGYGRELGIYGIREFVNVKTVWVE
jgi:acyl-CoA reductase-like NAD-dependent aldehyde dehydrogenase